MERSKKGLLTWLHWPIDQFNPPLLGTTLLRILIMKSCYCSSKGLPRHQDFATRPVGYQIVPSNMAPIACEHWATAGIYPLTSLLRKHSFISKISIPKKNSSTKSIRFRQNARHNQASATWCQPLPGLPLSPKSRGCNRAVQKRVLQ